MAGGTWTSQTKVRPGAYVNVRSESVSGSGEGVSGIATLPLALDFGPTKQIVAVNGGTNFEQLFAEDLGSENLLLLAETLKNASTVLLYRVNGGTRAQAALAEEVTVRALYGGSKGNDIRVVVQANVDDNAAFDVTTYLSSNIVDVQEKVSAVSDLQSNHLVEFTGEGNLEVTAGVTLEGGETQQATSGDYADYFEAVAVYDFNTMALPIEEEATKLAGVNLVKRLRDDEGLKCQIVVAGYDADHESTINVKNGYELANGRVLTPAQAVAWVAGATAGAQVNQSLTYRAINGATDAVPRLTNSETIAALNSGEVVFTALQDRIVVEQDINSLVTFTQQKNQDFRKNRVLRVLDDIANNSRIVFQSSFIGSVNNNANGRALFLANRIAYFTNLQEIGAIEDFAAEDLEVLPGEDKDAVVFNAYVKPVDSMEKLYMTVRVV